MSSHGHQPNHELNHENQANKNHNGYEPTDAPAKPLLVFAVVLTIFTVACFIGGFITFRILEKGYQMIDPDKHPMSASRKMPEGMPRLQVTEANDLAAFQKSEEELVSSYGWISREAGKVRVPVAKAIDLVLKKNQLKSRE
jgi:hypothetical protein